MFLYHFTINASKDIVNEKHNVLLMYLTAVFLLITTNKALLGRCEAAHSDCIFVHYICSEK